MDAETRRELARLRAEVATLKRQRGSWHRLVILGIVAALIALVPLSLLAANPFDDLTGSVHDPDIDLIYNAGITKGCVPDVSYCPTANVTRQEMASFLARTAGLGANPPVANAATLQGKSPADFLASSGDLAYDYSFYNVVSGATGLTFIYFPGPLVRLDPSTNLGKQVELSLDAPREMFGKTLAVKAIQVCYKALGDAYIFQTSIRAGNTGQSTVLINDGTFRESTTAECYTVTLPNPVVATGAIYLALDINFPAATDGFDLYSARLILTPQ